MVSVLVTVVGGLQIRGDMSAQQADDLVHTWTSGEWGRGHFLLGYETEYASTVTWVRYANVSAVTISKDKVP